MAHVSLSPSPASPTPSPSASSNSANSSSQKQYKTNDITAKCLVKVPLVAPPVIDCKNLSHLDQAEFVTIVFEADTDSSFFRISDENNKEVCRVMLYRQAETQPAKKGVKYLECRDIMGNCILYVAYPVGLGEVALLSPTEELIGECQSNVEFICLSVKVKYNFYDVNGNRLMKMTAIMPEEGSREKFMLMVKRSKTEKLALIKMGSLKSCCQIKFKTGQVSLLERLQIIALWTGFMHNEIQDTEIPNLVERHSQVKKERRESRRNSRKKSFIAKTIALANGKDCKSPETENKSEAVPLEVLGTDNNTSKNNNEVNDDKKDKSTSTPEKNKLWKNLVTLHFSRRQEHDNDIHDRQKRGSNNNVIALEDGDKINEASGSGIAIPVV